LGDIPSRGKRNRGRRTGIDTGASAARGTWIEADGAARTINLAVEQERGPKCDPGSEHRVNDDSDNTRSGKPRQHCQLHEIQCRSVAEWIYGNTPHARGPNRHNDFLFDHFTGEIVEWIFTFEPARVCCGVGLEGAPEISAAIPYDHN